MKSDSYKGIKIGLSLILVASLLFISGCWGKREIEELEPLIGIGFDLGPKPGTFLVTEQLAKPKKGGATAIDIEDRTFSIVASSAREEYEKAFRILNHIAFMGSLKVIIVGEDAAKSGFYDILEFFQRFSEFRRSMYIVVAKGSAKDILNLKLRNEQLPAMSIKSKIEQGKNLSAFPTTRLGHYLTVLSSQTIAPIIPAVESIKSGEEDIQYNKDEKKGEEMQIKGAGVFQKDHLVDYLTDEETKGYMWLDNEIIYRVINTVDIDNSNINFSGQVVKSRTKSKLINNNGTMGLEYQIKADVAVDEVLGLKKQISELEWRDLINEAEKIFARVIQKECESSINKQKKLGLDFLGVGRKIEEKDSKYWKTIENDWNKRIADFPIYVNAEVKIHHSGMEKNVIKINLEENVAQ